MFSIISGVSNVKGTTHFDFNTILPERNDNVEGESFVVML